MDPEPYDVLAVELSSFQLHYTDSMSAESAAVLNVAEDHLDWYASTCAAYAADKGRIYERRPAGLRLQRGRPRDRAAGPRGRRRRGRPRRSASPSACPASAWSASSTTSSPTGRSSTSARDQRRRAVHDRRPRLRPAPAHGRQRAGRRRPGPRPRRPARPRSATGCAASAPTATGSPTGRRRPTASTWVDDSKATNPHAAQSSLQAYDPVVWVAGGLAKGAPLRRPGAGDRATGCGASCCSAATATSSPTRLRDTRPMCPVIDIGDGETGPRTMGRHGARRGRGRRPRPARATRCCWPRDAPPWTCSPTTATAATRSPRRCTTPDRRPSTTLTTRGPRGDGHRRARAPDGDRPPARRRSPVRPAWSGCPARTRSTGR